MNIQPETIRRFVNYYRIAGLAFYSIVLVLAIADGSSGAGWLAVTCIFWIIQILWSWAVERADYRAFQKKASAKYFSDDDLYRRARRSVTWAWASVMLTIAVMFTLAILEFKMIPESLVTLTAVSMGIGAIYGIWLARQTYYYALEALKGPYRLWGWVSFGMILGVGGLVMVVLEFLVSHPRY